MDLIIDIGNSRTKLALFKEQDLVKFLVWDKLRVNQLKALFKKYAYQKVALLASGNIPEAPKRYLQQNFYFLELSHSTPLPITNLYKTPKTLGRDRLAGAIGAADQFPGKNCLIIDAGTCITYDFIDKNANYHGGSISPGIFLRLKAMNAFTAKLPLVKPKKTLDLVGFNTKTALQTGGQLGAIFEMEGFIGRYKKTFGKINVVLTGGDAEYFAINLKTKIFVNNNLVLFGLNKILKHNVQNLE